MQEAHETGLPVMRTLFTEFPEDKIAWDITDEYCYGAKYLVAPILYPEQRMRRVYLPMGCAWAELEGSAVYDGGQWIEVPAPLDTMPVFVRQ